MAYSRKLSADRVAMDRICGVPACRPVVPAAAPPVGSPALAPGLVGAVPCPGRFVRAPVVELGRGLTELARQALDAYQQGLGGFEATRSAYIECICLGTRWNLKLYGRREPPDRLSARFVVDGWSLGPAFEPVNPDAQKALFAGTWPRSRNRNASGGSPGLVWLPEIKGFVYRDGDWIPVVEQLDPPAQLLDALHCA